MPPENKDFILAIPIFISVDKPPMKSLIYEFALIKEYIEPKYKSFEKVSLFEEEIENATININGTSNCKKSKDKKILSHDLKTHEEFLIHKDKKAKGDIRIKTFNIINLKAYDTAKFIKPMEIKLFIKPSSENKLKLSISIEIIELKFCIIPRKVYRSV